jgi:amino acid adenylation domain-containing protein
MQNADRTTWQHEEPYPKQPTQQDSDSYWRDELSGAPLSIALPTDRPPSSIESFRGARLDSRLPEDLVAGLEEMSLRENQTLQITLLAAFQMLLLRYSGQEDIVVVSHIDNGSEYNTSDPNSLFGDGLLLRTDLSGNPRFREFLKRVESVVGRAYAHRDFHYEKLMEELFPGRHPEDRLLYPVGYVFTDRGAQYWNAGEQSEHVGEEEVRRCYLTLCASEDQQGLRVSFEYNREVFDESRIGRMLGHLQVLLEGVVADPELRLSEYQILSAEEREQILIEWNHTRTDNPREKCIHQLFEEQVEQTPEAIAVVYEGKLLTYSELNRCANQLAHYLRGLGVGPEMLVGICVERSIEMLIGLLGTLKAGGAYVPLDPAYPSDRLSFMLEDAAVSVLLTHDRLLDNLSETSAHVVSLDRDWQHIAQEGGENPESKTIPDNLAYVIYTSGSTGKPKGVMVSHRNVVRLFKATSSWFNFDRRDVWTLFHSYAFDFSVWEIWGALLYGGRLIVVPYWVSRSPEAFYELLVEQQVTVLNQTPSAFRQLIQAEESSNARKELALRLVVFGGEALELQSLRPWFERHGDRRPQLVNMYGITETTVHVTYRPLTMSDLREVSGSVIGGAIPDLQVYVLDQYLQSVPIGVAGEMYVGGSGLARGYLNQPELTAERLIANPFSDKHGARLYKTGDLARFLGNGDIEYLGRIDHQVKIRGFRIELGEIESVLSEHPAVTESVVVAREDEPGDKRLVAYLVGRESETPGISKLRSYLKEKLPQHMIPSAFVFLEKLPLTLNGKIDRRALPMPEQSRPELEEGFIAPRDSTEFQLASIWEKVLKIEAIGVKDNFFELGGDSLLAVRLFAQIREIFGKSFHLATLFRAPTIDLLARIIDQQAGSESWPSLVAIQPNGSKPPLYCAHACGANVLIYRTLARQLSRLIPDQPLYGLQAQGMDGKRAPHTRIEDMAAHYVKEVRDHQPEGPYYLLGDTWGGLIVFEMAQQLYLQGQKVALLAMLDTNCPLPPGIRKIRDHVEHLTRSGLKKYALAAAKGIKTRIMGRIKKNGDHSVVSAVINSDSSNDDPLQRTMDAISYAQMAYMPQTRAYPGCITYFLARDNQYVKRSDDRRLHWKRKAGGLEVHVMPGRHDTMREEPHVEALAEKLAACLQSAQNTNSVASPTTWETLPHGYHSRLETGERSS